MGKTIVTFLLFLGFQAHAQQAEVAFKIPEKDIIPEGIAWDPSGRNFYIGSIHKNKILRIGPDGMSSDFVKTNQDGIGQVLGIRVDSEGRLWACNNSAEHDTTIKISSIHVYDLKTGKLNKTFTLTDGVKHLFNDIHFTRSGDAYVTDSDGGGIYMIRKGSDDIEEFLKGGTLRYPNGITSSKNDRKLIVSTGSGLGIVSIDLQTKKVEQIPHKKFFIIGPDGLYRYKNDLIGVQNVVFPEGVLRYTLNEDETSFVKLEYMVSNHPLFDTPTTGVIAGDTFYFIANSQLGKIGNDGKLKDPDTLSETVIMKIKLN